MKKLMEFIIAGAVVMFTVTSCASVKKDCNGNKHYKQKGGFYL